MSTESPRKLGKYELQERLGRGGMAEVWKALDTQLQRYVAIKLLHANLQSDPQFVSRFQREAQVIASLHHPNIVQIHDFQVEQASPEADPIFYMVMSYIEGQTLADYIASTSSQGKIPSPIELVNLFTSISLAVDYAHQKGMIHRDIKPANILLDQHNRGRNPMGEPILTDFGLAKLLGVTAVTLTGAQMGTPLYTSPEQARGYPGNERSDLYSLGVILYEMVTGTAPFRADTPTAVLAQHLFATPPAPVLLNPNIPPTLTMVIMTALAKDPAARFSAGKPRPERQVHGCERYADVYRARVFAGCRQWYTRLFACAHAHTGFPSADDPRPGESGWAAIAKSRCQCFSHECFRTNGASSRDARAVDDKRAFVAGYSGSCCNTPGEHISCTDACGTLCVLV